MNKQRQLGLDILRIFSMLGIVSLHILGNGGAQQSGGSALNSGFLAGMFVLSSCSVNIFAMLTGYLYAKKTTVRSANLIKLLLVTLLYSALILLVFMIAKPEALSELQLSGLQALFPVLKGRYWYITSYVLLFVLIPYLNIIIREINKKQLGAMLLLLLLLLSVISTLMGDADPFAVHSGYTPLWLIVCYLIGAYIRLYQNEASHMKLWIAILTISVAVLTLGFFFLGVGVMNLMNYNSPFMVLNAVLLLLIFSRVRLNGTIGAKLIVSLSEGAFGVYIIHSYILVFDLLIADKMKWIGDGGFIKCVGAFVGIVVGIYLICWLIDTLRQLLFRWTGLDKVLQRLGLGCDKLMKWDA